MPTKLIVHCGRGKKDWLKITHTDTNCIDNAGKQSWFTGFASKKHATRFATVEQARGAIHMHCVQQRIKERTSKHKIFRIEDKTDNLRSEPKANGA